MGNLNYYDGKFEAYQRTYVLMDFDRCLARYLYFVIEGLLKPKLFDSRLGNTIPYIKKGMLTDFDVPLPPLEEQQHIVAILDEAFEGLDRAKANAEANLASARELFQAALGEAFNPPDDVKDGWAQSTVGEAFETVTGTTPKKSEKALYGDHLGLVKPPELADADVNSARCSDFLSEDGVKAARVAPKGAVLVGCIGNLGKLGITSEPVAFNQQINAIFPKPEAATPKFVFYYCMTPMFLDALNARASGTTVSIVNKSKFNSIPIPLPPLEGQKRIVERLDKLRERTSLLAASYANAKENADKLRQSLLAKAFAGELT